VHGEGRQGRERQGSGEDMEWGRREWGRGEWRGHHVYLIFLYRMACEVDSVVWNSVLLNEFILGLHNQTTSRNLRRFDLFQRPSFEETGTQDPDELSTNFF